MDTIHSKPRIVFMGTPLLAQKILSDLQSAGYPIVGVYTKIDKPQGRKMELQKSPVKVLAESLNIPVFQPRKFDEQTIAELYALHPDLIVVAAYGKILPKAVLAIAPKGAINVHTSLLPKFRGASPIQNALLSGEAETGVTIMLMDEGMDTGAILSQEKAAITLDDNCITLTEKLTRIGSDLLLKTIPDWINGKIRPQAQDNDQATFCRLIERTDGKVDWTKDAKVIFNTYRALTPWPGVFTFWDINGIAKRLKIIDIALSDSDIPEDGSRPPGSVFLTANGGIAIACGNGHILLKKVQIEGKKPMTIKDFTNGYPHFISGILN